MPLEYIHTHIVGRNAAMPATVIRHSRLRWLLSTLNVCNGIWCRIVSCRVCALLCVNEMPPAPLCALWVCVCVARVWDERVAYVVAQMSSSVIVQCNTKCKTIIHIAVGLCLSATSPFFLCAFRFFFLRFASRLATVGDFHCSVCEW